MSAAPENTEGTITTPQENEMSTLTHSIIEWRRLRELCDDAKQGLRENSKKMKALEEVILRVMKNHNIGALDLKSSGGRVLYKNIQEHREVVTKESIAYEKTE